jgi:MFS family permease
VAFQLLFSVVTIVLLLWLPESPRWLVEHGDHEESRAVIARLTGKDIPLDHHEVTRLHQHIQEAIELESAGGPFKYRELFTGGKIQNFRRILLCIAVDGFSQLSGINLITYYAPVIFQSIGLSRDLALLVAGFNATEYLLASCIPIWIIERVGRRQLMLTGSIGQALSMMVLAICVHDKGQAAGYVACVCLFMFNTFFSWGWLTVSFPPPQNLDEANR